MVRKSKRLQGISAEASQPPAVAAAVSNSTLDVSNPSSAEAPRSLLRSVKKKGRSIRKKVVSWRENLISPPRRAPASTPKDPQSSTSEDKSSPSDADNPPPLIDAPDSPESENEDSPAPRRLRFKVSSSSSESGGEDDADFHPDEDGSGELEQDDEPIDEESQSDPDEREEEEESDGVEESKEEDQDPLPPPPNDPGSISSEDHGNDEDERQAPETPQQAPETPRTARRLQRFLRNLTPRTARARAIRVDYETGEAVEAGPNLQDPEYAEQVQAERGRRNALGNLLGQIKKHDRPQIFSQVKGKYSRAQGERALDHIKKTMDMMTPEEDHDDWPRCIMASIILDYITDGPLNGTRPRDLALNRRPVPRLTLFTRDPEQQRLVLWALLTAALRDFESSDELLLFLTHDLKALKAPTGAAWREDTTTTSNRPIFRRAGQQGVIDSLRGTPSRHRVNHDDLF